MGLQSGEGQRCQAPALLLPKLARRSRRRVRWGVLRKRSEYVRAEYRGPSQGGTENRVEHRGLRG